ncbi:hypothetical protein I5M27_00135 [Adhaeribacter sp. BT258]|uniref:Lipoprotein n=1 Tax=Adhaeribacter terrigena TaxID=2793070 RepID=A0ABS1BWB2_9BACT|nr:hypothetical protein [Adhaeribacter terrigena]MBK0401371.1 hypothetical protein [Adhaeribacter terrigena]
MKNLFIILFTFLFFGCSKEKNQPIEGSLTCKLNGTYWTGKIKGSNRGAKFGFVCQKLKIIDGKEVPWQDLGFGAVNKNVNTQRLYEANQLVNEHPDIASTYATFNTAQDDGDVVCDIYKLIEADSLTNYIRITKETGNYKEVWGEFSVNFVRTRGCTESTLPDTLRIRDGQFHVVLE